MRERGRTLHIRRSNVERGLVSRSPEVGSRELLDADR